MAKKRGFVSQMDSLSWIAKFLLCLPVLNIVWAFYRIVKGASKNNIVMLIVGIIWIVPGLAIGWVLDMICTILFGRPVIFA